MLTPEYFPEMQEGKCFDTRGLVDIPASASIRLAKVVSAGYRTAKSIVIKVVSRWLGPSC